MKRAVVFMCRMVEIVVVLASVFICVGYVLSGHDNLEYGIQRIAGITGYEMNEKRAELILHKSNRCDSIVMVSDNRTAETIVEQMETLVETDARWKRVHIAESEAYEIIQSYFSGAYPTSEHFRPVCEIGGGYYDYMFYEKKEEGRRGDRKGCLVDIETGTIALYIYLD